jgi:hypothetical protein
MRKRTTSFLVRLTAEENEHLQQRVRQSGLSREALVRSLICGYVPKPLPPLDYFALLRDLHAVGNNLNQIAARANTTGHIDTTMFQYEANRLRRTVQEIHAAVTMPERSDVFGHDSHLGRDRPSGSGD